MLKRLTLEEKELLHFEMHFKDTKNFKALVHIRSLAMGDGRPAPSK
jgi:hypothetical protein